jgi:cysteinyl-tRNA synthetase
MSAESIEYCIVIHLELGKYLIFQIHCRSQIIENGFGYVLEDGDVYFSVDSYVAKYSDYGRLSGREQHENRAGERVTVDKRKRNPADFALWKVRIVSSLIMKV